MSTRVVRKLRGRDDDLKTLASLAQEPSSEESETETQVQQGPANLFSLLGGDEDQTPEKSEEEEEPQEIVKKNPSSGARKKNRKKKRKNNANKSAADAEDIDKVVNEIAQMEGDATVNNHDNTWKMKKLKYILTVEHRFLDPDNELRKIFGARTLAQDVNYRQRNRVRTSKGTWLASPSPNWPRMARTGLSMNCIDKSQKYHYFAYEHSKEYQRAQFQFLDAVDSSDHNLIAAVLRDNSYHIDSLLTLSEMCRLQDDTQMARELIERALYALEMNFHSQFNITTGHCRLPYKRLENRCLYLALFRHMQFVFQRGCSRTAMELCKVLLNLDPDEDPLCALLFIDFFALQAGEYDFLMDFFSEWEAHKNLSQLPNFAFSVAMAQFEIAQLGDKDFTAADKQLQDALIRFPTVLTLLLDKCSIQPDKKVVDHSFFTTEAAKTTPAGLSLLCNLFVSRNYQLWKSPEILPWLDRNANAVLERVDAKDPEVTRWRQRRKKYEKPPRNIYRYALTCELPGITALLPPEIRLENLVGHDPLPPPDTVISYERPERPNRGRTGNSLGLFLQSLMPQFDPNDQPDEEEAGANAAASMQDQLQALMGAMRDLLGNLPTMQQDDEEQEEFHEDEWD